MSIVPTLTTSSIGVTGPQMRTSVLERGKTPADAIRVAVDTRQRFQTIEGFGAAMTESAAVTIARLPEPQQTAVLRELFDPSEGMGFSYMRVPIGSSDFAESTYSYADTKGPEGDELKYFSLERDQRAVIPMLQRALSINPKIKLMISPWAPPEWMCVRDSEGSRRLDHKYFAVYADYLVRTLDAYAKLTPPIHIDALTSQNEPFFFTPNYPSLLLTPKEQIELIAKHLGPKLEAYNRAHASDRPKVKLFTHDHNWDLWPGVLEVLDGVGRYADAIAWHGYNGEVADYVKNVQPKYPNLPIYYTEITGIYWDKSTPQDDLLWDARNVLIGPLLAGARACLKWNIVLDGKNGPLNGGVDFLKAFLRVVSPQKIEANQEHYTMGVASTAVRPGAVRIGVKTSKDLECVAFQNPDGSRVLLAANGGDKPLLLALENGAQASLPPKSFSAVRW